MSILVVTALMFATFVFFPNCTNRVFFESDIGLGFIAILLGFKLYKVHWSVALMFLISAASAILMLNYQYVYQRPLPVQYPLQLAAVALDNYVAILLFGMLPFLLDETKFKSILQLLFAAAVFDAFFMLIRSVLFGATYCYAMLSNSAIDASFIACLIPCAYHLIQKTDRRNLGILYLTVMLTAIIVTKSSTGIAAVGIATASYLFMEKGVKAIKTIIPLALSICGAAYFYLRGELLNPNGRYGIWRDAFNFYWHETHRAIGAGVGEFFFWGPQIQLHTGNSTGSNGQQALFVWMHNDWLQILFELGIVGLVGVVILYSFLLKNSWGKKNYLFPVVCTYGFIALTQMPLRAFPFQILGACLIMQSFEK